MDLLGLHHLTAISADIRGNHRFYTQVLGLRLVKRSVNQDDVTAYHLFYADAKGNPGTDITFFDWPMPRERRGTHSIARTCMRVRGEATLRWWDEWLREHGVVTSPLDLVDGRALLCFEDPEGQRLALVDDGGRSPDGEVWNRSPVPAEHQIRGLGPVTISVPVITETEQVLTQVMNMRRVREYAHADNARIKVHVFEMAEGGAHAEVHVIAQPDLPVARQGAGGVHHVAFRTPTEDEYHAWTDRLNTVGIPNSGEIDRYWFRSLYFREPNGVLFEIATDGPGFAVDEDAETLGEKVVLPPFLEAHRPQIVAGLKPID
ncbi:MAG TPA: ring-cleaving dioxygenase [Longimicrobiales bacterium]|nr:ring-cleaving dioxygenase [Longimicrobiales bacterium]